MTRGIIVTHADPEDDLEPLYFYPPTLDEKLVHAIAIKAATLVYTTIDLSVDYEGTSVLQFPDKNITVLVYYFLYPLEEDEPDTHIPVTISLFIESEFEWFFYKEIEQLAQRIARIVNKIRNTNTGEVMEEDFKELYDFLDSVCRKKEKNEHKENRSDQMFMKHVTISDQQGFLDYYPFINLDLNEEMVSHLLEGDITIDELSKNFRTSSCNIVPLFQRLLRYKLIALKDEAPN